MRTLFITLIIFLISSSGAFGVTMKYSIGRKEMLIGDTFSYSIAIDTHIDKIDFAPQNNGITVLHRNIDIKKDHSNITFILAIFSTGKFVLPPAKLFFGKRFLSADTNILYVIPLTNGSDTQVLDIKPVWSLKSSYWWLFWLIGGVALLGAAFYFIFKAISRTRAHKKSPYVIAVAELNRLLSDFERLYKENKMKHISLIVSRELRRYFGYILKKYALDMTTQEFLKFTGKKLSDEKFDRLKDIMQKMDYIKFAKGVVSHDELFGYVTGALELINKDYEIRMMAENE